MITLDRKAELQTKAEDYCNSLGENRVTVLNSIKDILNLFATTTPKDYSKKLEGGFSINRNSNPIIEMLVGGFLKQEDIV